MNHILIYFLLFFSFINHVNAQFLTPDLWKLVFKDEFNGPTPEDDSECFELKNLSCYNKSCNPSIHPGLANLNKCNWSVINGTAWNDGSGEQVTGRRLSRFSQNNVKVENGNLILTATRKTPLPNPWTCNNSNGDGCIFETGMVLSDLHALGNNQVNHSPNPAPSQLNKGFIGRFGKFEFSAILSQFPGGVPALWLLGNYAYANYGDGNQIEELSFENWANWPNMVAGQYYAHGGRPGIGGSLVDPNPDAFSTNYHLFTVIRDSNSVTFMIDSTVLRTLTADDTYEVTGEKVRIPQGGQFFIIQDVVVPMCWAWQTQPWSIAIPSYLCDPDLQPAQYPTYLKYSEVPWPSPNYANQKNTLSVDFVRYWEKCSAAEASNKNCIESTRSIFCPNPCAGIGRYEEGVGCYLGDGGAAKNGKTITRAEIIGQKLFYTFSADPKESIKIQESHQIPPKKILFGIIPNGRSAFIRDNKFYLSQVCDPLETTPKCAEPCPNGGKFDGRNCYIKSLTGGIAPKILQDNTNYELVNKKLREIPKRPSRSPAQYVVDNNVFYRPACSNIKNGKSEGFEVGPIEQWKYPKATTNLNDKTENERSDL
ncbi:MAG: family 16 glycosylhydrolase [Bacteriovoracaceae bacterium]|nr:family 16 glycosylhydrolase [Bacteriovoracaceae bacterium]